MTEILIPESGFTHSCNRHNGISSPPPGFRSRGQQEQIRRSG